MEKSDIDLCWGEPNYRCSDGVVLALVVILCLSSKLSAVALTLCEKSIQLFQIIPCSSGVAVRSSVTCFTADVTPNSSSTGSGTTCLACLACSSSVISWRYSVGPETFVKREGIGGGVSGLLRGPV